MRPVMDRSESLSVYDGWALETAVPNPVPNVDGVEKNRVYVNVEMGRF